MKYCFRILAFLMTLLVGISAQAEELPKEVEEIEEEVFEGREVAGGTLFMLKPVVQFSCARFATPQEDAWEEALKGKEDDKKLEALGRLLSYPAPSSVPLQHKAYTELKDKYKDHNAVKSAAAAFNKERIKAMIAKEPFGEQYGKGDNDYYWCMRAVGVLQMKDCIPRLLELSDVKNLYTYLAAERSINDFKGKEGEDALIKVISFWKYNAYVKAGDEMLRRNKGKLGKALLKMKPPEDCEYQYALLLARTGNPKAVPMLCKTVGKIAMIDHSMFCFIAELGLPEHKEIILDLPNSVRKEQQDSAKRCIEKYLERMGKEPEKE